MGLSPWADLLLIGREKVERRLLTLLQAQQFPMWMIDVHNIGYCEVVTGYFSQQGPKGSSGHTSFLHSPRMSGIVIPYEQRSPPVSTSQPSLFTFLLFCLL